MRCSRSNRSTSPPAEVALGFALLRCGSQQELAENPALRLRLTVGLRKQQGRWVVTHEHHSFPDLSGLGEAAISGR